MPMRPAWAKRVGGCSQGATGQIDSAANPLPVQFALCFGGQSWLLFWGVPC
jgi:hypothetical protein